MELELRDAERAAAGPVLLLVVLLLTGALVDRVLEYAEPPVDVCSP